MSRSYTLEEVDRMRSAIESMRSAPMIVSGSRSIPKNEKQEIEEEIRTYMAAGVTPAEIEGKAAKIADQYYEIRQRMEDHHRQKEASVFRAHDIVKTEIEGRPRPKTKWTGDKSCKSCRFHSPAWAGASWDRCDHPSLETCVRSFGSESSYERPKCQELRLPLGKCGSSARLFEPEKIPQDEALWILAHLSPDAVRCLAFNAGVLGNSIGGLTNESEAELEKLGIDSTSKMNRVLIDHLLRAHTARISENAGETQSEPDTTTAQESGPDTP